MKCPKGESNKLSKNGHSRGRQQYRCKACGKRFIEPSAFTDVSQHLDAVVTNNGYRELELTKAAPSKFSHSITSKTSQESQKNSLQFNQRIAILLLDAENLKLDIKVEKFLAELCSYPLQVKIAFANWRNPAIGRQDVELYERGYQLIHVPGGKNSADAQMIAMGASINRHYPDAKEVFICSSDWLLTNLCNELESQGMGVYRVRRQDNTLSIENRSTGASNHYSLTLDAEIPSFQSFIEKIEELIEAECTSINDRIARLSTVTELFQERCRLALNENYCNSIPSLSQEDNSSESIIQQEDNSPVLAQSDDANLKGCTTNVPSVSRRSITSQEELEQTLIEIIKWMKAYHPQDEISVGRLSAELYKIGGEPANSIIKKLKLGANFTKFLKSCPTFTLEQSDSIYEVQLARS